MFHIHIVCSTII